MLEAPLARTIVHLLATTLIAAACTQPDPPVGAAPVSSGDSGASAGGTAGVGSAASPNSAGNVNTPGGESAKTDGGTAGHGASGAVSTGSVADAGQDSGGASGGSSAGGASGGSSAGGASGGGGSAGAAGASGAVGRAYSLDRATFGGEPRCQGLAVCESFEATDLGALPSGFTLEGYGTRQVGASAEQAQRGARSLKLEVSAQGAVSTWLTRGSLGPLAAQHFGRAFFRIESPAPSEFVHFDLFEGSGPFQGHTNLVRYASTGTAAGTGPANWSFIYNVQPIGDGAGAEFGTEGDRSAHPRVGDWMCLEWSFDASKQVAQYYLDGAAISYLDIDDERAEIPVFDSLSVGFGKYQNTGAFVVYVDEIAFDGARIGCNN